MKQAFIFVGVMLAIVAMSVAPLAWADTTSIVYPPSDGGSAALPKLSARKSIGLVNAYTVAICVRPTAASVCWPVAPGATFSLDVSDSHPVLVSLCSGAALTTCLPTSDAGVVTLEVQ